MNRLEKRGNPSSGLVVRRSSVRVRPQAPTLGGLPLLICAELLTGDPDLVPANPWQITTVLDSRSPPVLAVRARPGGRPVHNIGSRRKMAGSA